MTQGGHEFRISTSRSVRPENLTQKAGAAPAHRRLPRLQYLKVRHCTSVPPTSSHQPLLSRFITLCRALFVDKIHSLVTGRASCDSLLLVFYFGDAESDFAPFRAADGLVKRLTEHPSCPTQLSEMHLILRTYGSRS